MMTQFPHYQEPKYDINGRGFIIGKTSVMVDLFRYINRLANLPTSVLLRGETGTGKELVAQALHYNGNRNGNGNKFVAVDCAGIPSELLESELFGHASGSFTGAYSSRIGKFQVADRGTIFLDEIGDLGLSLQAKILRVLQERQITPVGSNEPTNVDVRVVAATNRDLEAMMAKGQFREDLYYRLNVVPISVPPLRERREDVPLIAEYFVEKFNSRYSANISGMTDEAKTALMGYEWKGNIRELENAVERVFVRKSSGTIKANDIVLDNISSQITLQQEGIKEYRQEVVDSVYDQMVKGGESFLTLVRPLYLHRDISRSEVRELVRKGMEASQGNYKGLTKLFNMEPTDYKSFLNFLRKHRCNLPLREFRPHLKEETSKEIPAAK